METTTASRRNVSAVTDIRIGHIIKRERELRRLTLKGLAESIGCNHPTIANYEAGRRTINRDKVEPLAHALGIDPRMIDPDAA
jgi:transcriptional regulator with XRE-family HTH domain